MNGGNLAIEFSIADDKVKSLNSLPFVGLATGYPIYIYDTQVGGGVTSINNSDSEVVGIGTTCVDNVYYISEWTYSSLNARYSVGILTCNIDSNTNTCGIIGAGNTSNPIGKYSWGRLSGGTRSSSPISIGVTGNIVSGFQHIQLFKEEVELI